MKTLKERFETKFTRGPECWLWSAHLRGKYGHIWVNGRMQSAPRVAWEIYRGLIPDGQFVLHTCDQPACVNPDHLYIGSHTDNMADMVRRGRSGTKQHLCGEGNHAARLTEAAVREVRSSIESTASLAKKFNVTEACVYLARTKRTWAWLN